MRSSIPQLLPLLMGLVLALPAGSVQAAPEIDTRGGRVTLEMLADVAAIRPGETFHVGLRIVPEDGWHTYWRHPGIVGIPTSLDWDLPAGFEVEEMLWPAPDRVLMTVLTAWGYKREVLLITPVQAPADLEMGQKITLRAKGTWMACAKTCHPGWGDFELTLPVLHEKEVRSEPAEAPLFAETLATLPGDLEGWETSVQRINEEEIQLSLTPESEGTLSPDGEIYFFSYDDQVHSDEPQIVQRQPDGTLTIRLKQPQFAPEDPKAVNGLVYLSTGWPNLPGNPSFAEISALW